MPSVCATSRAPRCRRLARRPDLELAVLELRRAVLRLERRVRDERIGVGAPRRPSPRAASAASTSPSCADRCAGRLLRQLVGLRLRSPSLLCDAVGPSSHVTFSLLARGLAPATSCRRRSRRRRRSAVEVGAALDDEGVPHAGQRLDLVEVRARDLAAEHRALLEHGVQHARHREVDAEDRLAGDDRAVVDAAASACR